MHREVLSTHAPREQEITIRANLHISTKISFLTMSWTKCWKAYGVIGHQPESPDS